MRRLITIILMALVIINGMPVVAFGTTEPPQIQAETGIVIDAKTGMILYDKNMNEQRYPASTTKVMTALLTLENLDLDQTVTIDSETPFTGGSRIYLLEGERITVRELLYALLLESANDAAVALAKEIAGTVPDFADMMNQRAKELGAKNTNFVSPNGLHDDDHVTTAYDMAMIARYAMTNETFRDFVATYKYTIPATNMQETRYLYNTNRLIYDQKTKLYVNGIKREAKYEGATGIKTGYTPEAGGCLIAGAIRGDTELIAVVLKSTDEGRFADSIALLDYAFENYKSIHALDGGTDLGQISVKRGSERKVNVVAAESAYATVPIDASDSLIQTKVVLEDRIQAPVKKGQAVGVVEVYEGDQLVGQVDIVTTEEVPEGGLLSIVGISDKTAKKIEIILGGVALILMLFLIFYIVLKRRQIKKRKQRRMERANRYQHKENQKRYDEYWKS